MNSSKIVLEWIMDYKLIPNWEKTNIIEYTFNRRPNAITLLSPNYMTCHLRNCTLTNCTCPNLSIVDDIKYLGLHIDKNLTWNKHIDAVYKKLRPINLLFYNLKKFMRTRYLIPIYYAYFQSVMQYGIIFWGGAGITKTNKIFYCQKSAVRMVNGSAYNAHTRDIFKKLQILPFALLYKKNILGFVVNNKLSFVEIGISAGNERRTRQTGRGLLHVPNYRLSNSRLFINYRGPNYYNEMLTTMGDEGATLRAVNKFVFSSLN